MGLALCVGMLADLRENDIEGFENLEETLRAVNMLLDRHGLPDHIEPLSIDPWDAEMIGYSGLHYLRRLAAYADSGVELPGPGGGNSSSDSRLKAYINHASGKQPGFLKSLFGKQNTEAFRREFDHLILHSDAEGFYLPQDFAEVLIAHDQNIPGGMLGSTPKLLQECERLARLLHIPEELSKDADELWEASDSQGEGDELWQRYGVESFTCVALIQACQRSLETGAAIVFA